MGDGRILTRLGESLETDMVVSVIWTGFMTCYRCVHHEGCPISKVPYVIKLNEKSGHH